MNYQSVCKLIVACLLLSGCTPKVITRTETVEVPVYVRQPVDRVLTEPSVYPLPTPACSRNGQPRYCNGQLLDIIAGQHNAIERGNADKAAIRKAGE